MDGSTWGFVVMALALGAATIWLRGTAGIERVLAGVADMLLPVIAPITGGLMLSGLVQTLVSKDAVSRWLGRESGMRGLNIALVAGILTPGGPYGAFALVYALGKTGADIGVLVTYLTAWTTLGLMRVVVWEIPFMGLEFVVLRMVVCLPMGIIAGVLARRLAARLGWTSTRDIVK